MRSRLHIHYLKISSGDSHSLRYYACSQPATRVHIPTTAPPHPLSNTHARRVPGVPQYRGPPMDVVDAIDQWITSSSWVEANVAEPLVGSQDSSRLVDKYGVRGLSCYSALVERRDDGSFGCRQERCMHFSVRTMEGAITHQRAHHYDHRPYTCSVTVAGLPW